MPKTTKKGKAGAMPLKTVQLVASAPAAGDQIVRGGLTTGRAGQAVAYANKWRENYNPMRGLTMTRAVALLESAQRGDTALLQWTYRFIEQMNPTLSGLISRCESPLANFDWHIKIKSVKPPGMEDEDFQAMADAQKQTLEDAYNCIDNLREAILHLHIAEFRGYAHLQKHYGDDGCVVHLEPLNQYCVCRDGLFGDWFWNPDSKFTSDPAHFLGEAFRIGGDMLPLDDFLIHECQRPINRIGLVHTIRHALANKDWDGFLEIYGIPGGVVIMPPNVPQGKEGEYESAAMKAAEGAPAALPNGSSYEANQGPRGVDPFTPRLKALDEQLILAGTGGKLTMLAESGSGTLAGGAHADTFAEIAAGRCKKISELFQRGFDADILNRSHADEPHLVYFEFGPEESEDITAIFDNAVKAKQAGKNIPAEWLAEKTGYQLEEERVTPATAPAPGETESEDKSENGEESEPEYEPKSEDNDAQEDENSGIQNRDDEGGSWITTEGGRHVFIRDGESVDSAMKRTFGEGHKESPSMNPAKKDKWRVSTNEKGEIVDGPQKMLGHTVATPGEYYHGTSAKNVDSILKSGIKPTDKTLGFKAAFVGQNMNLAHAYGAGSATASGSDEVAIFVVKHDKGGSLYSPKGATNIGYNPKGINPDQIDRVEIYRKNSGKDEKPLRIIRPAKIQNREGASSGNPKSTIASAIQSTLAPVLKRLAAIEQITDPETQKAMLEKLLADFPAITEAVKADGLLAQTLSPLLQKNVIAGLTGKAGDPQS